MTLPEIAGPAGVPPGRSRGQGTATALAAVAVALAFLAVLGGIWLAARPEPGGQVHTIEIPVGTADRIAAGEEVSIVPPELVLAVNDTVMIENHDDAPHEVGPFVLGANETLVHRFDRPGRYQGSCNLHADEDTFTIVVE